MGQSARERPSQEDGTWRRSAVFLRWKRSVDTITDDSVLELLIFSPSPSLQHNLEALLPRSDWDQALRDPFGLLVIVLDDLFRQLDAAMHKVLHILRDVERVSSCRTPGYS